MTQSEGHNPADLDAQDIERSDRDKTDQLKRVESDEDLQHFMSFPWGRRKMWEWLGICGVSRTPFREGTRETDFLLGMQNFGFLLQAECNRVCPNLYLQMLKEHKRG